MAAAHRYELTDPNRDDPRERRCPPPPPSVLPHTLPILALLEQVQYSCWLFDPTINPVTQTSPKEPCSATTSRSKGRRQPRSMCGHRNTVFDQPLLAPAPSTESVPDFKRVRVQNEFQCRVKSASEKQRCNMFKSPEYCASSPLQVHRQTDTHTQKSKRKVESEEGNRAGWRRTRKRAKKSRPLNVQANTHRTEQNFTFEQRLRHFNLTVA